MKLLRLKDESGNLVLTLPVPLEGPDWEIDFPRALPVEIGAIALEEDQRQYDIISRRDYSPEEKCDG